MKKILPIILIVVVILAALFFVYSTMNKTKTQIGSGNEKPVLVNDTKPEKGTTNYTFKALKAAITLGIPLKCSYKAGDSSFEGYLKGKQWRGKIVTNDGKKGEIILKDECMWSWTENDTQGMTLCFKADETGKSVWDMEADVEDTSVEYNCVPAVITDDLFNPPSDVEFTNINDLTGVQPGTGVEE